ncbi:fasciclin domain-containing protein, partial [Alkaliflexus imshenetskii]|uniref:fasciclin domain-containing protein n=1 Tax=Alkaliflexus imshenetskii TaxID=286730 RepID=UPI0006950504
MKHFDLFYKQKWLKLVYTVSLLVFSAHLSYAEHPATVVDIIVGSADHTTLATAVTEAGLVSALQGEGPFTVFAPTNAAFDALPEGLLATLLADPTGDLTNILLYHVVGAKAKSTDLSNGQQIATLLTDFKVKVTINDDGVFINDAHVTVADLEAENGVVHVIDAVLVPSSGETLPATVVDIIVGSADHTTLATAVTEAGLVSALQGEGPFTVFAPTNAAFDALPEGLLATLLADPTGDLTNILLYHVVGAKAKSTDLSNGQQIATLLTDFKVKVTINDDGVFINDAKVTVADLEAENGVVHVIDAVLVPSSGETLPATVVDIIVGS